MKDFLIEDVDNEDAEELLTQIERSFDFKFEKDDLINVSSIRDIYDVILDKFTSKKSTSCTSQKAFYILRKDIKALNIYTGPVFPETLIIHVLKKNRRKSVKLIETKTGFKLNLLRPPHFLTTINLIILALGLIDWIFYDTLTGIGITAISVFSIWISSRLGTVLKYGSMRELVKHVTSTNYSTIRKDSVINPNELGEILIDSFNDMGLTERPTLDSKFGWAEK